MKVNKTVETALKKFPSLFIFHVFDFLCNKKLWLLFTLIFKSFYVKINMFFFAIEVQSKETPQCDLCLFKSGANQV